MSSYPLSAGRTRMGCSTPIWAMKLPVPEGRLRQTTPGLVRIGRWMKWNIARAGASSLRPNTSSIPPGMSELDLYPVVGYEPLCTSRATSVYAIAPRDIGSYVMIGIPYFGDSESLMLRGTTVLRTVDPNVGGFHRPLLHRDLSVRHTSRRRLTTLRGWGSGHFGEYEARFRAIVRRLRAQYSH